MFQIMLNQDFQQDGGWKQFELQTKLLNLNNDLGQNMGSWQYRTYLIRNADRKISNFVNIQNKKSECSNCTGVGSEC